MRRCTFFIATAITIYSAITIASTHAATHTTTHSTPPLQHHSIIHNDNNDNQSTTPATISTFSCGTKLQTAKQCTTLCIDGDDSSCPPGQYCYAGIPCNHETVVRMEEQIIKRMMEEREGQTKRFVCAVTFEEAEKSCRRTNNDDDEIYYCESGQSSECPSGMQCFASVAYCSDDDDNGSTSLSSPQLLQQQQQPILVSFSSSSTTNATPTPNHQDNDSSYSNNNDNVYSIHTIVDTIGSKLWTSLGLVYS